jgi:probable phosphoglycerate mutase
MPWTDDPLGVEHAHLGATVYVARHGEIDANRRRLYSGRSAEGLTDEGLRQAIGLAGRLAGRGIAEVWTSEMVRAMETATIAGAGLGVPVRRDPRLNEMLLGAWEGLTECEVAERFPDHWSLWQERPDQLVLPGRERLKDVLARAQAVVADAARAQAPVLLVTHVALVRVLALRALGLPLALYKSVRVPNAEVMVFDVPARQVRRLEAGESLREELAASGVGEAA